MSATIDTAVEKILESYQKYGGINLDEAMKFPNRENVITPLTT